jgi:hypothetical protein
MVCLTQTWETSVENVSMHIVPSQLTGEGVDRFYGYHYRRQTKYLYLFSVHVVTFIPFIFTNACTLIENTFTTYIQITVLKVCDMF